MVLWIQYCGALLELHLPTAARASTLGSGVALVPGGGDLEGRLEACSAVEPSLVPLGSVTVSAVELREALEAWRGARRVSLSQLLVDELADASALLLWRNTLQHAVVKGQQIKNQRGFRVSGGSSIRDGADRQLPDICTGAWDVFTAVTDLLTPFYGRTTYEVTDVEATRAMDKNEAEDGDEDVRFLRRSYVALYVLLLLLDYDLEGGADNRVNLNLQLLDLIQPILSHRGWSGLISMQHSIVESIIAFWIRIYTIDDVSLRRMERGSPRGLALDWCSPNIIMSNRAHAVLLGLNLLLQRMADEDVVEACCAVLQCVVDRFAGAELPRVLFCCAFLCRHAKVPGLQGLDESIEECFSLQTHENSGKVGASKFSYPSVLYTVLLRLKGFHISGRTGLTEADPLLGRDTSLFAEQMERIAMVRTPAIVTLVALDTYARALA